MNRSLYRTLTIAFAGAAILAGCETVAPAAGTKPGADGKLVLGEGLLAHTNGIAMLAQRGFGPAIEANAAKVADWLSAYLAHPADCSAVLGTAAGAVTCRA